MSVVRNTPPVHLFEEHSSTLPVWWQQRPRTVVYLDAHLDLQQTDDTALDALTRATSVAEVRALEAPHPLDASPRFAYGIENFLYPAHRLGLIERLVWVAPPHVPRRYSPALLEYVQQMDGLSFAELTGFETVAEGVLRGRLLGLDITICGVDDLAALALPADYCLDVDIDYFVKVPGDTVWVDPGVVVQRLLAALGPPRLATVSRAVDSGFTPLAQRFVGDYVAALLAGDEAAGAHYHALYRALAALQDGRREPATALCEAARETRGDCAASCYLLAQCVDEAPRRQRLYRQAQALDPAYAFDVCREACSFPNRRRPLDTATLAALAARLQAARGSPGTGYAHAAVARLYALAGRPGEAQRLLEAAGAPQFENAELLLALAAARLRAGDGDAARPWLERARAYPAARTSATLHLGDLALRAGDPGSARALYRQAVARAPAWRLPLERLRLACEALGERREHQALSARLSERERLLAALLAS